MISAEAIEKYIENRALRVLVYDLLDSTNTRAKEYAASSEREDFSPVLFVAREQSAGRGRLGRRFLSRAGCGIYFSLLYFTEGDLSDAVRVTTATASAVALAIERVTGKPMMIKWVNDIYNEQGKVSGILAETLPVGNKYAVIVGVGVNTGEISFPEELAMIASSIGDINGEESRLIALIVNGILAYVSDPSDRSYMEAYRARFMLLEKNVNLFRADELICSGRVVGVDDDGGLLLIPEGESKPIAVHSGEVTVRSR